MKKTLILMPICAVTLALFYMACLAPITGAFGGLLFLLTGWAIPSLINLSLTIWTLRLLSLRRPIGLLVAVPVSFIIGINTHFPRLIGSLYQPLEKSAFIDKPVSYSSSTKIDVRLAEHLPVPISPLLPSTSVKGDEGCGCLYFEATSPSWFERSFDLISQTVRRPMLTNVSYELFPSDLPEGVHFDIYVSPDPLNESRAEFILDIFDGRRKAATYTQHGLYYDPDISSKIGREKRMSSPYVGTNSLDQLLHGNFWAMLIPAKLMQFPESDLKHFLHKALIEEK